MKRNKPSRRAPSGQDSVPGIVASVARRAEFPFVVAVVFFTLYFFPYLFAGKVMVPFQILKGNPSVAQEIWLNGTPPEQNGIGYDLLTQFYPWKERVGRSYKGLFFPLWNSFNEAGTPFLANIQVGYFYPANIFLLLFTAPVAVTLAAIFNILVAASGTWLYLRILGCDRAWCCLGAIGFAQSGFMVHWFQWVPHTGAMAWLPWMLAFIHLALSRGSIRWVLPAQAAGALALLSGHIQFAYYGFMAAALYAVVMLAAGTTEWSRSAAKRIARGAAYLSLFAIGTGLLAACQLWPSWELTQNSLRGKESVHSLLTDTLGLNQAVQLWSRKLLGSFDSVQGWGGYSTGLDNPYIPLFLSGAVISVFVSGYAFQRALLPLLAVTAAAFGVAFGQEQIFNLMAGVPLFDHFRAPSRFGYIASFALVCLSALFLSNLCQELRKKGKTGLFQAHPYAITLAVFVTAAAALYWNHRGAAPAKHVLVQVLLTCLMLVLYQTAMRLTLRKGALAVLPAVFLLLGSAESLVTNFAFNPRVPKPASGLVRLHPALEKLGAEEGILGRMVRVSDNVFEPLLAPPNLALLHSIPDMQGYDTFIRKDYVEFFEGIHRESLTEVARRWNQVRNFRPEEIASPSLRLLGVHYALSTAELGADCELVAKMGSSGLYKLPQTLPRVFLIPAGSAGSTHRELLHSALGLLGSYGIGISKTPNGYQADVKSERAADVVLGELHYPGWRVWIDGAEAPVQRIGGGLISVSVESGAHRVNFEYRPASFFIALYVSLAAWGVAGLSAYFLFRRRSDPARGAGHEASARPALAPKRRRHSSAGP